MARLGAEERFARDVRRLELRRAGKALEWIAPPTDLSIAGAQGW
ncbi:MAG: hypothetical protein P4L85_19515 [Paludisphaera borealis]|nr:hypothetical protein [Paludisphaera borealis]MDR3621549.1 hypothetical protein [Paludisphaera borealis]